VKDLLSAAFLLTTGIVFVVFRRRLGSDMAQLFWGEARLCFNERPFRAHFFLAGVGAFVSGLGALLRALP
jgi:hypothetical protein